MKRVAGALAAAAVAAASIVATSGPAGADTFCRNQTVYASRANVGPFYYRIAAFSNSGNRSNGDAFLNFGVYLDGLQSNPARTTGLGVWEIHISGDDGFRYSADMQPVKSATTREALNFDRGLYETARWHNRSFYARLITGNQTFITTPWLKIGCPEQR